VWRLQVLSLPGGILAESKRICEAVVSSQLLDRQLFRRLVLGGDNVRAVVGGRMPGGSSSPGGRLLTVAQEQLMVGRLVVIS